MNEEYEKKEATRLNLITAFERYMVAAKEYGLSEDDMATEIENALDDAGLGTMMVITEVVL